MADIVFKYEGMESAATQIDELAGKYASAANTFETDFIGATAQWEGASKEKMNAFISGPVKEYMGTTVPKLLNSLAELLRANATQMQNADQQIADNIPNTLG